MRGSTVDRAATSREVVTIPTGSTGLSRGMDIRGMRKGSVLIPAGASSWAAADLTFMSSDIDDPDVPIRGQADAVALASTDSPTYAHVRTAAASAALLRVLNIPTSNGGWMPLPAALFEGHAFIKARSTKTSDETVIDQTTSPALIFRFSS